MRKRWTGHIFGGVAGIAVAAATMYLSYTKLKQPQIGLDWASLIFSGLIAGIIAFFIVWGHFQKDPAPRQPE